MKCDSKNFYGYLVYVKFPDLINSNKKDELFVNDLLPFSFYDSDDANKVFDF